jgi:hypothetical protein
MQQIRAYQFPFRMIAQLDADPSGFYGEFRQMYSRQITTFKGVDNPVRINFLNTDQKFANIATITANVNVFTPGTQYQWFSKPVVVGNASIGSANVTFLSSDLAGLELGFYEIGMTATDTTSNITTPVFLNDNYQGRLPMELQLGPVSAETDPISLTFTDVSNVGVVSNQVNLTIRPAGNNTATFFANLAQPYTGNIIAQGTLVTNPVNSDFGNITVQPYANISGPVMFNVLGTYAVMRFIIDTLDPAGNSNIIVSNFVGNATIRY